MPNQYSGLDEREYNGWPNKSTWLLNLWKSNEEEYDREYGRIVSMAANRLNMDHDKVMVDWFWPDVKRLYRIVWEAKAKGDGCIWKNIDWQRLKEHFLEDVEDAKR